ncbi:hypothetical protein AXF19_03395 [Selenomonas sp. oral taxon 126]|uniref:hypothetical protein n=1 Tax=Selenomonas sp. oral taxon 126 TaxID=712528 RepID=UPI00080796D3|nr:hypothetical protein [Selenomonas sp. oral taxon 126]ANR70129.1 hypothetical protein AXF19_03395 [Selenomonas sp. oral taxon 126]
MTRLVRLNEVQYAETEEQAAGLMAQGFEPAPLPTEAPKEDKPVRDGKAKKKEESGGKEESPPESNGRC